MKKEIDIIDEQRILEQIGVWDMRLRFFILGTIKNMNILWKLVVCKHSGVYKYIYTYTFIYFILYIYIYREREREKMIRSYSYKYIYV